MKYAWPPMSLYETLHTLKVPGSPAWKYDGQFIWLPMPQRGYGRYTNQPAKPNNDKGGE